jgi:hypothetical protein
MTSCAVCTKPIPGPTEKGGRTRRYCSDECIAISRRKPPAEPPVERYCPACRGRFRFPKPRDSFSPSTMKSADYHWLENAARVWDELTEGTLPAYDFVAWLRPDIAALKNRVPDFDGARPVRDGQTRNHTVHRHPDPVPYVGRITRKVA